MVIKVGIIGCGFMGKMHANCYKALQDVKVMGVSDIHHDEAKKVADLTGAKIFSTPDELINSNEIDAVAICLSTYLHKEFVIKSARAKKHVFCEKPIALTLKEAEEMIKETKKAKVKFIVGMVLHFWPEYVEFKKIVDSKKYGKLTTLVCTRISSHPVYGWDKWYSDPKRSGSAILDLHIHDTDFIYYLLGKPQSVYSSGRKTERGWEHIYTTYEYRDAVAVAEGGWDLSQSFGFVMAMRGVFEDGTVLDYNSKNQPLIIYGKEKSELVNILKPQANSSDAGGNISDLGGYYNEIKYWVDCLKENKYPKIVTPEGAKSSLEIVLKEVKSAETGKKVLI